MSSEPILRVDLNAGYPSNIVLRDIRLELRPGEVLGLVGSSGAGKSTLVLSLLGLLPWCGGRVTGEAFFAGQDLLQMPESRLRGLRGRKIAFIPQSPTASLNPAISLRSHFREAWRAHSREDRGILDARVEELLSEVKLPSDSEFLRRRPAQISVGQAQRVLIALALLHRPDLIIADEPTSALDPVTQKQIIELLHQLNQRHGTALLYISHDLVSVLQLSDRIAILSDGTIVETLATDEVTAARHPATRGLLATLPAPPHVLLQYRNKAAKERGDDATAQLLQPC